MERLAVAVSENDDLDPRDILFLILLEASKRVAGGTIEIGSEDLQREIKRLQPRFRLLECFIFSDSGPKPFSPPLQDATVYLQCAGLVIRPDLQSPKTLEVRTAGMSYWEKELKRCITIADFEEVGMIADELVAAL